MYQAHPAFDQPPDTEVRVWRYINLTKLASMLDSKSLFFSRADKLDDKFEESWPKSMVPMVEASLGQHFSGEHLQKFVHMMLGGNVKFARFVAVNCWHVNPFESAAMWKLYSLREDGIAIQSTYSRLRDSFSETDQSVYLGLVRYIDYDSQHIPLAIALRHL